jgi:hypothetical protein
MVELFTSAGFKWGSTVLPPLGQHPSSEGGGDGGPGQAQWILCHSESRNIHSLSSFLFNLLFLQ